MNAAHRTPRVCGVWRKFKPVSNDRWLKTLLMRYLDERTKGERTSVPEAGKAVGDTHTGIWVFGHLDTALRRRGTNFHNAEKKDVVEDLLEFWLRDRAVAAVKAQHFTASFSPSLLGLLRRKNLPEDAFLMQTVQATLVQFGTKFYPGRHLGWVASVHHDTDHPHLHALVHPTDSSGRLLRFAGLKKGEEGVDHFEYLREAFNARAHELYVALEHTPSELGISHSLAPWLLMAREAYLQHLEQVQSGQVATPPSALHDRLLKTKGIGERVDSAFEKMRGHLALSPSLAQPEAEEQVTARFAAIKSGWRTTATNHRQTLQKIFEERRRCRGAIPPVVLDSDPSGRIIPPQAHAYVSAKAKGLGEPMTVQEKGAERQRESKRHLERTKAAVKEYHLSATEVAHEHDDLVTFLAYLATKLGLQLATLTGTLPKVFGQLQEPKIYGRFLFSKDEKVAQAEEEIARIEEREAALHCPDNPEMTRPLLCFPHRPKLGQIQQRGAHLIE